MSHRPEVKLGVPPIPAIKRPHLDLTPGPLHSLGSPTAPSVGGGVGNGTQGDAAPAALRRGRPRGSPHGGGRLPHRGARDPPPPPPRTHLAPRARPHEETPGRPAPPRPSSARRRAGRREGIGPPPSAPSSHWIVAEEAGLSLFCRRRRRRGGGGRKGACARVHLCSRDASRRYKRRRAHAPGRCCLWAAGEGGVADVWQVPV